MKRIACVLTACLFGSSCGPVPPTGDPSQTTGTPSIMGLQSKSLAKVRPLYDGPLNISIDASLLSDVAKQLGVPSPVAGRTFQIVAKKGIDSGPAEK